MSTDLAFMAGEINDLNLRISQLEKLNSTLAAEIDRMRPVVEAAIAWCDVEESDGEWMNNTIGVQLVEAVDTYETSTPK